MGSTPRCSERRRGRGPAASGALDQPLLQQVGLVHVLDRVLLLADRDRERREPDGPTVELDADRPQDLAVEPVEPLLVDLQQVERAMRGVGAHHAVEPHLRVVAHALEQAVGHARGPAAAGGDRKRALLVDVDLQDLGRAPDDPGKIVGAIVLQARLDAEAIAQRRRQQPRPRRGAHERELGQLERHDARARALARP